MKKRKIVIDSQGNEVDVMTVNEAAKFLGVTKEELRIWMFKKKLVKYYKVATEKKFRVIRLKKDEVKKFKIEKDLYDQIADRIKQARKEAVYLKKGMSRRYLAKEVKLSLNMIFKIEHKLTRPSLKAIKKIASVTGKPIDFFFT